MQCSHPTRLSRGDRLRSNLLDGSSYVAWVDDNSFLLARDNISAQKLAFLIPTCLLLVSPRINWELRKYSRCLPGTILSNSHLLYRF